MFDSDKISGNENEDSIPEISKIPWPGIKKYFSYISADGAKMLVKYHKYPLNSLSSSEKSPFNLERHIKVCVNYLFI